MNRDHRWLWIVLGVLVFMVLLGPLLSGGMMGPGMMWSYRGNGWLWGLGMGLGALALLAFAGALIVGGLLLVGGEREQSSTEGGPGGDDPLTILQRRYAAGEIDRATYTRMKRDLTGTTEWTDHHADEADRTNGQGTETPVLPSHGQSSSP
jgi:putative membrane protein